MYPPIRASLLLCLLGCGDDAPDELYVPLDSVASLHRVSMALRGKRPSLDEIQRIEDNPKVLKEMATEYAASEDFGKTIGDMYAERLLMRSTTLILPSVGALEGVSASEVRDALSEEPIRIIEEVVNTDSSFGEIVNADWTILDETAAKIWADHTYDTTAGGIQKVTYTDDRPNAGILRAGSYLVRHESNGANYNRSRANIIADTLLCASFSERDIPITGDIDLSDDLAVAEALLENAECVSCHQSIDPLAAHYWGYRNRLTPFQIATSYTNDCDGTLPPSFSCYPVSMYQPTDLRAVSAKKELRGPNYWGAYTEHLGDVGAAIASDPRFSQCVAKTFLSYLTQAPSSDLQTTEIARLQVVFDESGQSARSLAVDIVTSPAFLAESTDDPIEAPISGHQVTRPEQLERMVQEWTGFTLSYRVSQLNVGDIRAMGDDVIGFRAMSGGVDGSTVTSPTHTPTPVKLLAFAAYAEEAAGYVVTKEFSESATDRTLLRWVEPETIDETSIRTQITTLIKLIHGTVVTEDDEHVSSLYSLWSSVGASNPTEAWKVTLSAMFQSPDTLFY